MAYNLDQSQIIQTLKVFEFSVQIYINQQKILLNVRTN